MTVITERPDITDITDMTVITDIPDPGSSLLLHNYTYILTSPHIPVIRRTQSGLQPAVCSLMICSIVTVSTY